MHVSVGAVIYTIRNNEIYVLLMHRTHTDTFHLCKGTQEDGETHKDTALREIKEETNCDVILEQELGSVASSFLRDGCVIQKKTYYFVARYLGGIPQSNDGEHDMVDFYSLPQARELLMQKGAHKLGYEDERKVLQKFEMVFG